MIYNNITVYLLQHSLSLDGGVIGPEVFVLVDIFLEREQLFLKFISKAGQSIPDVIGQLLIKYALQVWGAEPVCQMSVGWVAAIKEEN